MSTTPTAEQIVIEVETLKRIKPFVRHFTQFHDDNWSSIDAQVWVLEERATQDDVYNQYPEDEDENERGAALEAAAWLTGERDDDAALHDDWMSLVPEHMRNEVLVTEVPAPQKNETAGKTTPKPKRRRT